MKKVFLSVFVAIVVHFSSIAIASARKSTSEGASITCSSGDSGRCFKYEPANTTIPQYDCKWTGKQKDIFTHAGIVIRLISDFT